MGVTIWISCTLEWENAFSLLLRQLKIANIFMKPFRRLFVFFAKITDFTFYIADKSLSLYIYIYIYIYLKTCFYQCDVSIKAFSQIHVYIHTHIAIIYIAHFRTCILTNIGIYIYIYIYIKREREICVWVSERGRKREREREQFFVATGKKDRVDMRSLYSLN